LVCWTKRCPRCKAEYPGEEVAQWLPPHGNYAFDLIAEIGLLRFRSHLQAPEIQTHLDHHYQLEVPETTINYLAVRFLDGLAAVHEAYAPQLQAWLQKASGGYVMQLDGTCEAGTSVRFIAVDGESLLVLHRATIPTENARDIRNFIETCVRRLGWPLATVRDLSDNIRLAREAAFERGPAIPDFVCQQHLLENIGEKLLTRHRNALDRRLRHFGLRSELTSKRRHLQSRYKDKPPIPSQDFQAFLKDPDRPLPDQTQLRRLLIYTLIRWIEDCTVELRGEYFPFDQPELVFYRRARDLFDWLDNYLATCPLGPAAKKPFENLRDLLGHTRQDAQLVAAAARLERAFARFNELRRILRLQGPPGASVLRQHPAPPMTPERSEEADAELRKYRRKLPRIMQDPNDCEAAEDAKIIADYLDKYWDQLFGHLILPPGREKPILVKRTNYPPEHVFARRKRSMRRQTGNEKLARRLEASHPAEQLIENLSKEQYLRIVFNGDLRNLPQRLAQHWPGPKQQTPEGQNDLTHSNSTHTDAPQGRLVVNLRLLRDTQFFQMLFAALNSTAHASRTKRP